jgi:PAS domain S-box-containing protein
MDLRKDKGEAVPRQDDAYYRQWFQFSPDSILITRLHDGRIMDMNTLFLEKMGYTREELIGQSPLRLGFWVNPEDREILVKKLHENRGICTGFETLMRTKQGKVYPVSISERKQMEEALRKSEERYRLLAENANEAILVIQEGMIKFVNPQATKIMNLEGRALAPQPFLDFIHPEDREMVLQPGTPSA